jgi:hypothetical protein
MPTLRIATAADQIVAMAARLKPGPKSYGYSQDELLSASRGFAQRFSIAPGCLGGATLLRGGAVLLRQDFQRSRLSLRTKAASSSRMGTG